MHNALVVHQIRSKKKQEDAAGCRHAETLLPRIRPQAAVVAHAKPTRSSSSCILSCRHTLKVRSFTIIPMLCFHGKRGDDAVKLPDHQSPEENNMHRQAAVSSKLTRCEENSSAGQVASDREVPTVHLFWYKYKERQIIHASQVSVKDG
jgi:hypothetical protein